MPAPENIRIQKHQGKKHGHQTAPSFSRRHPRLHPRRHAHQSFFYFFASDAAAIRLCLGLARGALALLDDRDGLLGLEHGRRAAQGGVLEVRPVAGHLGGDVLQHAARAVGGERTRGPWGLSNTALVAAMYEIAARVYIHPSPSAMYASDFPQNRDAKRRKK